jgi:hypothetical protein
VINSDPIETGGLGKLLKTKRKIADCENCNFLCRIASHEAFLCAFRLLKREASDGGAGLFFHLQLISIAEIFDKWILLAKTRNNRHIITMICQSQL